MLQKPICIIPARGGSKRIPRKNIIDFNGKPLIAWSILTALSSKLFSQVVVSTEDDEISEISRQYGAMVPFSRDPALADDFATTADVLTDALANLPEAQYACCLYPTAPLINKGDLINAYDQILRADADCVLSITGCDLHPLRALRKSTDGRLSFNWPKHELERSQDLPELVHDAGAFYFFNIASFLKSGKLIGGDTKGIYLNRAQAVDINTQEDLDFARELHGLQLKLNH